MSLQTSAIFQGADQNIIRDAVISSTPDPMDTYPLEVLGYLRPDWRVRWDTTTVTVTFTTPGPDRQGDIFVLPMSNLDTGVSPSIVTLTNGSGLSQALEVPALMRNNLPKTLVVDLTVGWTIAERTASTWSLVINGNSANVTLGGAVAIYGPKTALGDRDFKWGYRTRKRGGFSEQTTQLYQSRFIVAGETMERSVDLETFATTADADALEGWFDANCGRGFPGLLWLTPEVEDAFLGVWQDTFERTVGSAMAPDTDIIRLTFTELSKGIPLL